MKKKILTLGMVLALVAVLVAPNAVLANGTTEVTGTVTEGYTFTPPSTVALGNMAPSVTAYKSHSTGGRLDGNDSAGYTVTGIDENTEGTAGYMLIVGGGSLAAPDYILTNKLEISSEDASYVEADTAKTFLDTSDVTGEDIALYVSQLVTYDDPTAIGYTITITFDVTPKT